MSRRKYFDRGKGIFIESFAPKCQPGGLLVMLFFRGAVGTVVIDPFDMAIMLRGLFEIPYLQWPKRKLTNHRAHIKEDGQGSSPLRRRSGEAGCESSGTIEACPSPSVEGGTPHQVAKDYTVPSRPERR